MDTYKTKKYYIKTYGCQANIADSNSICGILEALGFEPVDDIREANLAIVNTCSVRQKSEDKVYGMGKMFSGEHKVFSEETRPFVIMAGCMVGSVTGDRQRYAFEDLKKKTPWVSEYINPSQIREIPNILLSYGLLDDWTVSKLDMTSVMSKDGQNKHAYINISYGCDNFCTFCVVPYARGKEVWRSRDEIIKEILHFVQRGVTHITLCGQNVNSWGLSMSEKFEIRTGSNQKLPFAQLLRDVHAIEALEKIDFLSSNPFDFTQDLIDTIALPKISNYLHIAVQSGNNEVLKKMNRRHTIEDFEDLVAQIKSVNPKIELGTDIIVGFPGETRDQYMDTATLFKKIRFNVAYISIYSPRRGTPAEKFFADDVPLKEKKWRHAHLTNVWKTSLKN